MALFNCKECGREISDRAEKCPHCGCPTRSEVETETLTETTKEAVEEPQLAPKPQGKGKYAALLIILAFVVLAIAVYMFGPSNGIGALTGDSGQFGKVKGAMGTGTPISVTMPYGTGDAQLIGGLSEDTARMITSALDKSNFEAITGAVLIGEAVLFDDDAIGTVVACDKEYAAVSLLGQGKTVWVPIDWIVFE